MNALYESSSTRNAYVAAFGYVILAAAGALVIVIVSQAKSLLAPWASGWPYTWASFIVAAVSWGFTIWWSREKLLYGYWLSPRPRFASTWRSLLLLPLEVGRLVLVAMLFVIPLSSAILVIDAYLRNIKKVQSNEVALAFLTVAALCAYASMAEGVKKRLLVSKLVRGTGCFFAKHRTHGRARAHSKMLVRSRQVSVLSGAVLPWWMTPRGINRTLMLAFPISVGVMLISIMLAAVVNYLSISLLENATVFLIVASVLLVVGSILAIPVVGFFVFIFTERMERRAKQRLRNSMPTLEEALVEDIRAPVLLLRSFQDEMTLIKWLRRSEWVLQQSTLEEALALPLSSHGPVIAIGDPRRAVKHVGAARAFYSNETWQHYFHEYASRAACVVVVLGKTPSVGYELGYLSTTALSKTIILMPPGSLDDRKARWKCLLQQIPQADFTESDDTLGVLLAVGFGSCGEPVPVVGRGSEIEYYLDAIDCLLARMNAVEPLTGISSRGQDARA